MGARSGPITQAAVEPRTGAVSIVWPDSPLSGDAYDEIVKVTSTHGGLSWTSPVVISGDAGGPAFIPSIAALPDGTVGIAYYDFRRIEPDTGAPPVNYWLTICRAACTERASWTETPV